MNMTITIDQEFFVNHWWVIPVIWYVLMLWLLKPIYNITNYDNLSDLDDGYVVFLYVVSPVFVPLFIFYKILELLSSGLAKLIKR